MIITLEGVMGSGKTTTAAALAYVESQTTGRKVISNVHLNFPFTHFDIQFFLEHLADETLEDCILILDEAYLYLDARTSAGKLNKLFTYFMVQTRKRGVDLYVCTHHIDIVDKRLRRAVDIRGVCRYFEENPCRECKGEGTVDSKNPCPRCLGYGKAGWVTTRFIDLRSGRRSRIRIHGPSFWGLFATEERIPFTAKQMKIPVGDL